MTIIVAVILTIRQLADKTRAKFKNIFKFWFWSLSLVLRFALCALIF
jgi:hypothetical protein